MTQDLFFKLYGNFALFTIVSMILALFLSPWFFLGALPTVVLTAFGLYKDCLTLGD